jgi:hypothetical protein
MSREFLDRIPKYKEPKRKPPRVGVSTCLEQHTLAFVEREAADKGMSAGRWIRHVLELLESGEF